MLVMASEFGWGIVGAGFALGAFGGAQTLAQLAYARANRQDSRDTLGKLELAELAGTLLLFGRAGAARGAWRRTLYVAAFLLGSATQYCANCLMSAPFNALLLAAGGGGGGGGGSAALDSKVNFSRASTASSSASLSARSRSAARRTRRPSSSRCSRPCSSPAGARRRSSTTTCCHPPRRR